MSREKKIDCKHYDQELCCCKMLSDWSEPMPVLQPCVEGACPKEKAMKQIEERCELIDLLDDIGHDWDNYIDECQEAEAQPLFDYYEFHADAILEAGYRKQSEGEWIVEEHPLVHDKKISCSCCGYSERRGPAWNTSWGMYKFCPNCGSKMKGGAE